MSRMRGTPIVLLQCLALGAGWLLPGVATPGAETDSLPAIERAAWIWSDKAASDGRGGSAPRAATPAEQFAEPDRDFRWPAGVVFVADDCSLGSNGRTLFRTGRSRSWTQNDIPGPSLLGRRLMALRPTRPDAKPTVLFDARGGCIGSPSVSFDGQWVR